MRFTIGIIGAGAFAREFIPLFQAHPNVREVYVADPFHDRVEAAVRDFGIRTGFRSDDELIASGADAVAIFAQRHLHGPLALKALRAGKHVYCAVPAAESLDEPPSWSKPFRRLAVPT